MYLTQMARMLTVVTLLAGLGKAAFAEGVDDYLKAQMVARHIPGLSVAVVQDGKVVKTAAYGVSNVEANTPATVNTLYGLGSCTKPFTAVAVLQLMETGKVDLDAPVSRYLTGLPAAWSRVTVRQLLTHTSGLPNYREFVDYSKLSDPKYHQTGSVVALLAGKPLRFIPSTKAEYSNTNYHLLGQLVEKVSGQTYAAYLASHQFQAAGITETHFAALPTLLRNQASGYEWDGKKRLPNTVFLPAALDFGDDGLLSTAGDLAKWTTALASGQLVGVTTLKQMISPQALPDGTPSAYGLGLIVGRYYGQSIAGHSGATPGYSSTIDYFVDSRLAVVVLCNLYDGTPLTDRMALGVAGQYLPAEPSIADTDPQTAALLKRVSAQIAAGTLDKSLFAPAFQALLPPAAVDPAHALLAPLGPLTSLVLLRRDADGLASYRAVYGTASVDWLIAVDKDHKITTLRSQPE